MLVAQLTDLHLGIPGAEIVPGIDAAEHLVDAGSITEFAFRGFRAQVVSNVMANNA